MGREFKNSKNVLNYMFGQGSINVAGKVLDKKRNGNGYTLFFIDSYFKGSGLLSKLPVRDADHICFVDTTDEPKTTLVDELYSGIIGMKKDDPCAVIGIGGGSVLDVGKAISNLLTNGGKAEDYQGWDLAKKAGSI